MVCLFEYRDYRGSACSDITSGRHFGMVLEVLDAVVYEAVSAEGLKANFEAAVDEYIDLLNGIENDLDGSMLDRPAVTIIVSYVAEAA